MPRALYSWHASGDFLCRAEVSWIMNSRTVRCIMKKLPNRARLDEIDAALAWFVQQQRDLLAEWDAEAYEISCVAIDDLLDARTGIAPPEPRRP